MKRALCLLFIFVLLSGALLSGLVTSKKFSLLDQIITQNKDITGDVFDFTPQDIVLRDDAFHGMKELPFTEWWYFDVMFDNGYSAQMSVRVIGAIDQGFVFTRLDIYKDGQVLTHNYERNALKEFYASSDVPFVQIQGKTLITGYNDEEIHNYVFDLSFAFSSSAVELHFVGSMKGWKGQHHGGDWWAVILPRADVSGSITIENQTMNVTGIGYHDHNWDISAKATLNFGWYWGRINSENYSLTWSTILATRMFKQPILVINEKNTGYSSISSKDIWFTADDYHFNNIMRVPHFFNIEAMTNDVFLVVDMQVIGVHHDRFMGFMNYWRYHIKCTGTIMIDGHAETVDGVFIAEYLRFR